MVEVLPEYVRTRVLCDLLDGEILIDQEEFFTGDNVGLRQVITIGAKNDLDAGLYGWDIGVWGNSIPDLEKQLTDKNLFLYILRRDCTTAYEWDTDIYSRLFDLVVSPFDEER